MYSFFAIENLPFCYIIYLPDFYKAVYLYERGGFTLKKIFNEKNIFILCLSAILALVLYIISDQYIIVTSEYTVKSDKITNGFKIAVISDLHNMDFGGSNKAVLDKISEGKPDIIAVVGDIIDESDTDITPALNVMNNLPSIAPTYYVAGNHDRLCPLYESFKQSIMASGVSYLRTIDYGETFISRAERKIIINGDRVALLGLHNYSTGEAEDKHYTRIMRDFCRKKCFKILLCHYPEYTTWFFEQDKYYKYNFDLMLSGHTHGGVINIPFIGGIIAPNQGLFPEYCKGLYYIDKGNENPYNMIITGGLGEDRRFMRVNNFPEITFVNVVPDK